MQNNSYQNYFQKLFAVLFCVSILSGGSVVFGQTRPARPAAKPTAAKMQNPLDPNHGWSGVVTYSKTLSDTQSTDVPVFGRLDKERNRAKETIVREYKYEGRLFVDGAGPELITKTQVILSDEYITKGEMRIYDSCHAFNDDHLFLDKSSDEMVTKGFVEGPAQQFNLSSGYLTDLYSFSFRFPRGKGVYSREIHNTRSGYCQPKNNEPHDRSEKQETPINGESVSIQGKLDPENRDVIAGRKTWGGEKTNGIPTYKYTVTWSFRRKPAPLELESVEFDEHPYPDFTSWKKIDDQESVDSNIVRIRAKVVNYSAETKFPQLVFSELKAAQTLPGSETGISIAPGETSEVEYLWDTSGWAWENGNMPMSRRNIKVEMTEPTSPRKELVKDFIVTPRPVILANGLWTDHSMWDGYEKNFYKYHSSIWRSFPVGKDPSNGRISTGEMGTSKPGNTIIQNAGELGKQIEHVQKTMNAWHLDIVAHDMGGLISRSYINDRMKIAPDNKPTVTRLIMLGTPNMGSPCTTLMGFAFWSMGHPVKSLDQLRPTYLEGFNQAVRNRKGTRFSSLAGTPFLATCQSMFGGDGMVEILSAVWEVADSRLTTSMHQNLRSDEDFANFVIKRLAVSHRGNNLPDLKNYASAVKRESSGVSFISAAYRGGQNGAGGTLENLDEEAPTLPDSLKLNLAKEITLQPRQKLEIEIPVTNGTNSGVIFIASPNVSALLVDDKGVIAGESPANGNPSTGVFRSIVAKKSSPGVWKLKLENTGGNETNAAIAAWTDNSSSSFIVSAGKPNAAGQIPLTASLTADNAPVTGAAVVVKVKTDDDTNFELALHDDGQSGDGAANDGLYGATTEKLADGNYMVAARAESKGQVSVAAIGFSIRGDKPKTTAKTKGK